MASVAAATAGTGVVPGGVTQQSVPTVRDKADNRDSGVADMDHNGSVSTLGDEACTPLSRRPSHHGCNGIQQHVLRSGLGRLGGETAANGSAAGARPDVSLKRTTLSNSLLDIHDPTERYQRRGSVGSLDSGMSISFQSSTTTSTMSRDSSPKNLQHQQAAGMAVPSSASGTSTPSSSGKTRGLQHQSSFLGNIFHKARERKNSRGSECAPAAAAVASSLSTSSATASTSSSSSGKQPTNSYPTPHCTDV